MQVRLREMADSDDALGPLNPFAWLAAAGFVLTEAIRDPDREAVAVAATKRRDQPSEPVFPPLDLGGPPFTVVPAGDDIRAFRLADRDTNRLQSPAPPDPRNGPDSGARQPETPVVSAQDVRAVIDQDAVLHFFCKPGNAGSAAAISQVGTDGTRQLIGFQLDEDLHRFNVIVSAPTNRAPLAGRYKIGETSGKAAWRWMRVKDGGSFSPGSQLHPQELDRESEAPQPLAMVDGEFKFGNEQDGFRATGTGHACRVRLQGRREMQVSGIAALGDGFGKFKDRGSGILVCCGTVDSSGYRGSVLVRVNDTFGTLETSEPLARILPIHSPEHGVTWLTVYAEAESSGPAAPLSTSSGPPGVVYQQQLRLLELDVCAAGAPGLKSTRSVKQLVGTVTCRVVMDESIAEGTAEDPLPFATWREFSFVDFLGKPVGGFVVESTDGYALRADVCGAKGFRFGGVGNVISGTGRFKGMSASFTESTFAVLNPCVSSSVYTLRVDDTEGSFLARDGVWRDIPVEEVLQKK
jgi:hypothetical protein